MEEFTRSFHVSIVGAAVPKEEGCFPTKTMLSKFLSGATAEAPSSNGQNRCNTRARRYPLLLTTEDAIELREFEEDRR